MTQDSLPSHATGSIEEGPSEPGLHAVAFTETFDVEPPYLPDVEATAGLEAFGDRFLDRELSWLHFNQRVLEMAEEESIPLLERDRVLAIFASTLAAFFMAGVAGLRSEERR